MLRHSLGPSYCRCCVNIGNADLTPECLWKREVGVENGTRPGALTLAPTRASSLSCSQRRSKQRGNKFVVGRCLPHERCLRCGLFSKAYRRS